MAHEQIYLVSFKNSRNDGPSFVVVCLCVFCPDL